MAAFRAMSNYVPCNGVFVVILVSLIGKKNVALVSAKQVFWKSIVTVFAVDVRFGTCAMWCIFIGHIGHGGYNTVDGILMWSMSFVFWKGKQNLLKKAKK